MCITNLSNFWRCKMFEKIEIQKTDTHVEIFVQFKRRVSARQMRQKLEGKEARKILLEKSPELKIAEKPEKDVIIDNVKRLSATWKFALIKEQPKPVVEQPRLTRKQRREALAELTQLTEEAGGYEQELSTENREKSDLTEAETCDKVDEAEEKAE